MRTFTKTLVVGVAACGILAAGIAVGQQNASAPVASTAADASPSPTLTPSAIPLTKSGAATGVAVAPEPLSAENSTPVQRGAYLVKLGDCVACHTQQGGQPFTGGRPLETPFGTVLSANLTPDDNTGIGKYTPETFYRAMHEGVDKDGQHLYPAFPYNYYTRVTRDDTDAMLTYFKSLPPVSHPMERNQMPFPFKIRGLMAFWNGMFLDKGTYTPDSTQSPEWNRGAYLVEGLGHCQACHTAKNPLGGNKSGEAFRGGLFGNWYAPDITPNKRTGIGAWTPDDLREFFREGRNVHSAASGEMGEAVQFSTSQMTDADLGAIVTYLNDLQPSPDTVVPAPDKTVMHQGEAIWRDQCAACHRADAQGVPRYFPPLQSNAMVQQSNPTTIIHYILAGASKAPTSKAPSQMAMPAFGWKLDDQQIAAVATYARNSWGNSAPAVQQSQVEKLRKKINTPRTTPAAHAQATAAPMGRPGPATLGAAGTLSTDNGTAQAGRVAAP